MQEAINIKLVHDNLHTKNVKRLIVDHQDSLFCWNLDYLGCLKPCALYISVQEAFLTAHVVETIISSYTSFRLILIIKRRFTGLLTNVILILQYLKLKLL